MKLVIVECGKFRYLIGPTLRPVTTDENNEMWEVESLIIMAWLVNSMELRIEGHTYITAHQRRLGCWRFV